MQSLGESSNAHSQASLWKMLWKMKVSQKVKIFAWKSMCHDGLPSYQNLKGKHINVEGKCVFCHAPIEDSSHALFSIPKLESGGPFISQSYRNYSSK